MPKQRKQTDPQILTLEALISDYDKPTLERALAELQSNVSWKVFRAVLIKEYMDNVNYSLDNAGVTGKQIEAARYAGIAQALYDTATTLIEKYRSVLKGEVAFAGETRPE